MRFFVLPSIMLGSLLLLTSCASYRTPEAAPHKTFQYSYKGPARVLTNPGLSRQLSSGKSGSTIKITLDDNRLSTARLGRNYFSANGHECRKYSVESNYEYTACRINGRWYDASPIILKK